MVMRINHCSSWLKKIFWPAVYEGCLCGSFMNPLFSLNFLFVSLFPLFSKFLTLLKHNCFHWTKDTMSFSPLLTLNTFFRLLILWMSLLSFASALSTFVIPDLPYLLFYSSQSACDPLEILLLVTGGTQEDCQSRKKLFHPRTFLRLTLKWAIKIG